MTRVAITDAEAERKEGLSSIVEMDLGLSVARALNSAVGFFFQGQVAHLSGVHD